MNRRTYLGLAATGMVGSVAGCTSDASDGSEYPPYPDAETIELSGDGPTTTERFEITQDGPTLVDAEHMGSDTFIVNLDTPDTADGMETNESDGTDSNESSVMERNESTTPETDPAVATVVDAIGPYDGRSLLSVSAGTYVLEVLQADAEWTAMIYDLPAYEDGVGTPLPIKREGTLYDVIGPINFGDQTETEFSFSVTGEGFHRVDVTDREASKTLRVTSINGDGEDSVSQTVGGVGYIEILSTGSWTFELNELESEPNPEFSIRIIYDGSWQGSISITGGGSSQSESISGTGTEEIEITGDVSIISANAQKQDGGSSELKIQILNNGNVVSEASTSSAYGVAQVSDSF